MSEEKTELVYLASFDIGKKNFSWCIEVFDPAELSSLREKLPCRDNMYADDGTPTEEMSEVLSSLYMAGKIVHHENTDLTKNCDPKKKLDPETFHNMIEVLDKYRDYWDKCNVIVIEEQMSFGKKVNLMAIKLAQHCYSYFALRYGREKIIISFPAYHKTQILGAKMVPGKPYKNGRIRYKAMEQRHRKKWAVEKCVQILEERGEEDALKKIRGRKKADDMADTFLQAQACKYLMYVTEEL